MACPFEVPPGSPAYCGQVSVPEDPSQPQGRQIKVAAALLPSLAANPAPDPLVLIQGGPGASGFDYFGSYLPQPEYAAYRARHDLIIVELRGTHHADPFLACQALQAYYLDVLEDDIAPDGYLLRYFGALGDCKATWTAAGVDFSQYTSTTMAQDIPLLLDALGYAGEANFYGVSYGSLVAQRLLQVAPERVRSLILDGVVVPHASPWQQLPYSAERAFGLMFQACQRDAACTAAYPDLEADFWAALSELDSQPARLNIEDPQSGRVYRYEVGSLEALSLMFNRFYVTEYLPKLPQEMAAFIAGDYTVLEEEVAYQYLDDTFSDAVFYAAVCAEYYLGYEDLIYRNLPSEFEAAFEPYFIPRDCEQIPSQQVTWTARQPIESDRPALILSGQFDPITPPAFGKLAAGGLSAAYVFTLPGMGHGTWSSHPCADSLVAQFLDQPEEMPNAACIRAMALSFSVPPPSPNLQIGEGYQFELAGDWVAAAELGVYIPADSRVAELRAGVWDTEAPSLAAIQWAESAGLPPLQQGQSFRAGRYEWAAFYVMDGGQAWQIGAMSAAGQSYLLILSAPAEEIESLMTPVWKLALETWEVVP
jgi:pimeloyl-ACP methyl ester carboxylesterase